MKVKHTPEYLRAKSPKYLQPKPVPALEAALPMPPYEVYKPEDFWQVMRPGALDHEAYPSRVGNKRRYIREWMPHAKADATPAAHQEGTTA